MCLECEVGMRSEKLARVRWAHIHKHGKKFGYYPKYSEKSLKGSEQGSNMIQFMSARWGMEGHGGVRWTREAAAIPVGRRLQ